MALTSEEESKVRSLIAAFTAGQQVNDLPAADMTATDKSIEVFNTKTGASEQMSLKNAVALGKDQWCGRVWNLDNATPKAATYVGSLELLRNLPVELGLGCYLVKNDHSRRKLDSKNHYKYATGEAAKLDGSEGHYQWGWGKKFYFVTKTVGRLFYMLVGLSPIKGEYNYTIPVGSRSASGFATMERSTGRLVSCINTGTDYRGGDNNSSFDGTNRTLCGKAASNMTTEQFRAAARKNGTGWLATTMRHTAITAALFGIIFGTHEVHAEVNTNKDTMGLYQGGLGAGTTEKDWSSWSTYNGNRPFLPMEAGIELGDSCGQTTCKVLNDDGSLWYEAKVNSFFGLRHGVGGYLWLMMDDEQVRCNADTSVTHLVAPSIYGTWTIGSATGMQALSTSIKKGNGWVTMLSMDHLENFPTSVGGSQTTYWCCYYWNDSGVTSGFRLCLRGGSVNVGGPCGSSTLNDNSDVSDASVDCGAALCEAEEEWPIDPVYYVAA